MLIFICCLFFVFTFINLFIIKLELNWTQLVHFIFFNSNTLLPYRDVDDANAAVDADVNVDAVAAVVHHQLTNHIHYCSSIVALVILA